MFLLLRTLRLGVKSLLLHPMRSLLTVLGIFIGVAAVIWLLAIGESISQQAQRQIEGLGADNIMIRSKKPINNPDQKSASTFVLSYGLLREDFDRLIATIPTIRSALPIREVRREVRFSDRNIEARIVGCTPEYMDVTRLQPDNGHFISDAEVDRADNHCVLAERVARTLFPYEDPIGRRIFVIENQDFYQIVGVMKHREATAAIGGSLEAQDFDSDIYIPITTMRKFIGDVVIQRSAGQRSGENVQLNQITLRIDNTNNVRRTASLVEQTLSETHKRVEGNQLNDVSIVVPYDLLERAKSTRMMFMLFMGLIAGISLLVGGIGIMNIMLATVTERTREIGIRRALGAKRSDIIRQFLVETTVLSAIGGITGIVGGYTCQFAVPQFLTILSKWYPGLFESLPPEFKGLQPIIVPMSVPLAFFISVVIGIMFGIYPAIRAAQMDPIEALRHE